MHSRIFCSTATSTFEITLLRLSITRRSSSRFNFSNSSACRSVVISPCAIFFSELRDVKAKAKGPVNCATLDVEGRSSRRRRHPDGVVARCAWVIFKKMIYIILIMPLTFRPPKLIVPSSSELRDVDAKGPVNCAALDVESRLEGAATLTELLQ